MSAAFQHPQSYMAPEILNDNENTRQYSVLVDMWATGVVVNEMLTKTTPFRSVTKVSKVASTYNNICMAPDMLGMCFSPITVPPYVSVVVI